MKTIEIERCTVCKSSVIDDTQNGERICSGCGIVVSEQMEDYGPETTGSSLEDKTKLARATGQTTYSQHDLGITTEISTQSTDYSGKKIKFRNDGSDEANRTMAKKSKNLFFTRKEIIKRLGKNFRNL